MTIGPEMVGDAPQPEPASVAVEPSNNDARPWQRLRRNPLAFSSLIFLGFVVFCAVFARFLAPYSYATQELSHMLAAPGHGHLLGTDDLGRDTLSRVLYGAQISLKVAIGVETFVVLVGVTVGLIAGFFGGIVDTLLMRVTDVMLAFPDILLAILLLGILGTATASSTVSILLVIGALGFTGWPPLARLVRGQVLSLRKREFVEAARALGASDSRIVIRHILPNLISPILVAVTVDTAGVIVAEATLSFLGIGVQRPFPSWGSMINDALEHYKAYPILLIVPSLALSLTVLALNFLGDGLRDALDPRRRG